jgi:hypothetical protein
LRRKGDVHDNLGPSLLWAVKPPAAGNMLSIHTDCLPVLWAPLARGGVLVAAVTPQRFARARHRRQPIRQSETPSRVPIRHLFSRENLMSLRFSLEKRWRMSTREGVSNWRIGWRIGWRLPCSCVSILATVQLPRFWSRGGARHGHTELA